MNFTGRINAAPSEFLHEEVLAPQFTYEVAHLLRWYILIERVLLLEHQRLGLLGDEDVHAIADVLDDVSGESLIADPESNLSDISFGIERHVLQQLGDRAPAWHVDRSRNDVQACAQLLCGRDHLFSVVEDLFALDECVRRRAGPSAAVVMPGYTHFQQAQVISPAFHLAALSEHLLDTLGALLTVYDLMNRCPLGAGAMAGQELAWDRKHMASLLGFNGPQRHALVAVSSREWLLRMAAELSTLSNTLSRFTTDLIHWGSGAYGFIDLPDDLVGISSAMPQKRNLPVLERIRGKTAHVSAAHMDMLLGQRNTPYTNLVEVSKEGGAGLLSMISTTRSILRLLLTVFEHLEFREDRMRAACDGEYLGGFALANLLTLRHGIPYRTAQVITGRFIANMIRRKDDVRKGGATILRQICRDHGYEVDISAAVVSDAFDLDRNLHEKCTAGSTSPECMRDLLSSQERQCLSLRENWDARRACVENAFGEVEALLRPIPEEATA